MCNSIFIAFLALESPVRPLSKKQKKRRSEKREREAEKQIDPRVLRQQRTYLKKQMDEPETQEFIDKIKARHCNKHYP